MHGEQWICKCGVHNFFMRLKCRECDTVKPDDAKTETAFEAMANVERHNEKAI